MSPTPLRLAALVLAAAAAPGATPQALPTLSYDPPANFYRGASAPPEQYFSNEVNANLQVYPFRPFSGDVLQQFQRSLLKEWIDPQYREGSLVAPPQFSRQAMPGAQQVVTARFAQGAAGLAQERMRILIVAGGAAALVDLYANSASSWQRAGPAMQATIGSMRVATASAPPASGPPSAAVLAPAAGGPPGAAARALAGVYMGSKGRYLVDLNRPVGYGRWVTALHFYLFSADGRVYRTFDPPGGDPLRFDFDAAQRTDPENSGRYAVQGDRLTIRMGGPQPETTTAAFPQGKRLVIDKIVYLRQ
jgi:hypothetical protein